MKYKIIALADNTKRLISYDKDFFQWSDLLFWMEEHHHISERHKTESKDGYNYFSGDNDKFPSCIVIRMTKMSEMDCGYCDDDYDDCDEEEDDCDEEEDDKTKIHEVKMTRPLISRGKMATFLSAYRTGSTATLKDGKPTKETIYHETLMVNLFGSLFNVDFSDFI